MYCRSVVIVLLVLFGFNSKAQHRHFKQVPKDSIFAFTDSTGQLKTAPEDSVRMHQFAYVMKFFPQLPLKNIVVDYRFSKYTVVTKPKTFSIFKDPEQRIYKVRFSKSTASAMDSVLISTLSFDSQLGLIATQYSIIEDISTGGFFNYLKFYFRNLTPKGRNKIYHEAEERCLEIGLGYQLLAYNLEFSNKLKIENWQSTAGYKTYIKYYRNRSMKTDLVKNFLLDLPVYRQFMYR